MGTIHVLPETIANKIAAGEVVERPASIVKELIENSLDAGATSIEVEVKNGGKSFLRVADNGSGMSAEDAELALQRHATSKISTAEDLENIASFGFRGEALASISAVSRVKILTRLVDADIGTEVSVEGGRLESAKPAPCSQGTVVEIRDLFFNTPARRKFLRTDSTELGHIMDFVSNLALANPKVRFVLKSVQKTMLDLVPVEDVDRRMRDLWGEEDAKQLIPFEGKASDMRVYGMIGKPFLNRANRSDQSYFINRRWIKSIGLSYALQDGYRGLLMHGQFPVAAVYIDVDADRVDVNVHPTKQEVRISREREIKSLLSRAVTEALQREGDLAPDLQPRTPAFASPQTPPLRNFSTPPVAGSPLHVSASTEAKTDWMAEEAQAPVEISEESESIAIRDNLHITKVLGQIHNTFIVAETEEGMIVVDQHAAHEKIMFEQLVKEFESEKPKSQHLLMDEVLDIHPKQQEIMKSALPFFEKIGFEIESFGENSFVIRAVPVVLQDENPVECVKQFLQQKESGQMTTDLEMVREELAAMIACKRKSVKAHDALTPMGALSLLKQLAQCENPFNCPHGRPSLFKNSFEDLEKQFKRVL